MTHRILREAKVPHLITAEFGFEYKHSYALVVPYYPSALWLNGVYTTYVYTVKITLILMFRTVTGHTGAERYFERSVPNATTVQLRDRGR
jgi:hypothetical protein